MNRRDFLRRLTVGGVAAATAVREWPFRVFSFPQEIKIAVPPQVRVRFIRAFDPAQAKMVNRWDVLYGFMKLDEANRADFNTNCRSTNWYPLKNAEHIKIASPEEARNLGLVDAHIANRIEQASLEMQSGFETTSIAPPRRWLERYESEES